MNVIYQNKNIKFVNYNKSVSYDITDIRFFVPNEYKNHSVYLAVKGCKNNMLKLDFFESHGDYKIFKISNKNNCPQNNGITHLKLIFINPEKENAVYSEEFTLNILFDYFKSVSSVLSFKETEDKISEMYSKTLKLTEMNISIHKEIKNISDSIGKAD